MILPSSPNYRNSVRRRSILRHIPVIIAAMLLLTPLTGCGEADSPASPGEAMPVIEGSIDSNGNIMVYFTSSLDPEKETTLADHLIRWGKVTVADGEEEIILTGAPAKDYWPPFYYYGRLDATPGKTYTIRASYHDMTAEARCSMPPKTSIKRIDVTPIEDSPGRVSVSMAIDPPADCPAYYCIYMRNGAGSQKFPCMMSATKVESAEGGEVGISVFNAKTRINHSNYEPHFLQGDTIEYTLCRITEDVYDYWYGYFDAMLFGNNLFLGSSSSLKGNIEGGYGIWSAQSTDRALLILEPGSYFPPEAGH